jgi:hypothetical protein
VRKFLATGDPIGRRVRNTYPPANQTAPWWEVVGVVADATYLSLRDDVPPIIYLPLAQQPQVPPQSVSASARRAARPRCSPAPSANRLDVWIATSPQPSSP